MRLYFIRLTNSETLLVLT